MSRRASLKVVRNDDPAPQPHEPDELVVDLWAALPVVLLFAMVGFVAWLGRAQW